ncbi:MAG: NAD(P)H-hydrate dehydratase [Ruminococcaceae bacterium]|nr:NAD(P)H-hydrate dehydratase [Oscillospiraceae bacterium]
MKVLTGGQMRELERITVEDFKVPSIVLMENAASGFCTALSGAIDLNKKKICVFCGRGNNGGDGFAIARHLKNMTYNVSCVIGFDEKDAQMLLTKDAYTNYLIASNMGIEIIRFEKMSQSYDIIIDAILGTGLKGAAKNPESYMIKAINKSNSYVVSVDVPSGADASNGNIYGECVHAHLTITFCRAKVGHFLYPCKDYAGEIIIVPISIPEKILDDFDSGFYALSDNIYSYLPKRCEHSHKGDFGKVLAYLGSDNMKGAALLCTSAIFNSGVGMVTVASTEKVLNSLVLKIPEAMTLPLDEKNDEKLLLEALSKNDVLLLGCGIGKSPQAQRLTQMLILASENPMVIDADGINNLSTNINVLYKKKAPVVLTPHMAEFSRLTGVDKKQLEENKLAKALSFSKEYGVTLVLKNADTIVATPSGKVYICTVSNSGMAKAGSGDVLAGIIAGLIAQGASPDIAAAAGVYIHSVSGSRARCNLGARSMTASDIVSELGGIFKTIN